MKQKNILFPLIIVLVSMFCGCSDDNDSNDDHTTIDRKEYFTLWNNCDALSALKEYVTLPTKTPKISSSKKTA